MERRAGKVLLNTRLIPQILFLSSLTVAMLHTQEMPVPVHVQLPILMKIVTFDRNLKKRETKNLVIGILYQSKFRMSLDVKDQLVTAMHDSPLNEVERAPIRYVPIDLEDQTDLQSTILRGEITVLYITPLRAIDIGSITAVSQALHILSFTAVPDYVDLGVAVGLGTKGDHPQIIINLPSARAEGADFNSQLLKLAKIIR